ncbi:MAG: hypothetical protein WEC84_00345 [Candidatus Andersenbacteria bacterium]
MKWKLPPRIKIYEALGAVGNGRIKIDGDTARVISSSGNKEYIVQYDREKNAITANDNGSYWRGYLGYPSIAFLMKKGVVKYDSSVAELLKGIAWKDVNQMYKNDFPKTEVHIHELMGKKNSAMFNQEADRITKQLEELNLDKITSKAKPPQGY